ncbi:calcium-binding protein [Pleurocapsa sp. PCC 7319]|uniref:calcium-binding protein n=1 Tax=Pleurocapsa sp. PCC 7319 TaxID=118161 RepID=UPI0003475F80|nr:calcium-binding protein [Pleurocapsa sp. PCC 7319]
MASLSFSPTGSQLDNDSIADLQVNPDEKFSVSFELDTSGLDNNLLFLELQGDIDITELLPIAIARTDDGIALLPDVNIVEESMGDNFASQIFTLSGLPGAAPDTIEIIIEGEYAAVADLKNDGQPDLGITVLRAIDVNGKDVTNLFQPLNQAIDIQPFPVVSIDLEPTLIIEGGDAQTVIFNLSEPAPPGGLIVDTLIIDSDTETDTIPVFEQAQNLIDAEEVVENGQAIARFIIEEGATQASLDFAAIKDGVVEGTEGFSLELLPRDGYTIDPDNNTVTSTIIDADTVPVVSIDLEPNFLIEGGEFQSLSFNLSEPAPPGGLVVDALLIDPDNDTGDVTGVPDLVQNIDNAELVVENGQLITRFTITEGATQANFGFAAVEDNRVEGNEIFSLTLLPRDGYTIDSDNSIATSVIVDADTVINGTVNDDLLNGTDRVNSIFGNTGDDAIFGNGGEDALFGEEGNDLLISAESNDFLDGGKGNDRLVANGGDDILLGNDGRDRLIGGDGLDTLTGGNDNDTLVGDKGNDILNGDRGDDRLIGIDINSNELGSNENDTLTGGSGVDTFVLGIETGVFYDDGDINSFGDSDFALITDFNAPEDSIQLFGFAEQYSLDFLPNSAGSLDAQLIYDSGIASGSELIAVIKNVTADLSLDDPAFTFV